MVGQKSWLFVIIYSGLFTCELDVTVIHCIFAKHIIYYVQFVLMASSSYYFAAMKLFLPPHRKTTRKLIKLMMNMMI